MAGDSKVAIYGAIAANILIAISKFIASIFTGSSAMLAEGIHSLVDTGDGLLLLLGTKKAKKKPDKEHPFGYGKEVYFWSFVVSILIFALGGGFAIYEGIHSLKDPEMIKEPTWNYVVLGLAIIFEGTSLYISLREFRKEKSNSGHLLKSIIRSKDATTIAVIIEDSAAVTGLIIALTGIFLSLKLQNPYLDGVASILIGTLLLVVATFLARETKGLLVGESMRPDVMSDIEEVLESFQEVEDWNFPRSMHFGPKRILLILDLSLKNELSLKEVKKTTANIKRALKEKQPKFTQIYIQINDEAGTNTPLKES